MGTLELHPWPAREDNVERPDYLVFDLDPGEGTTWKDVVRGAVEMRELLEDVGFTTFLRTSGGKGLHVVVPIDRRTTWDDFKRFAKSVADKMTREAPDRYIATMSKAKRHGKIFIDYLRNQRGATAIASYSTRRRKGAPVATPIAWDELNAKTAPRHVQHQESAQATGKTEEGSLGRFLQSSPIDHGENPSSVRVNQTVGAAAMMSRRSSYASIVPINTHIKIADAVPSIVGSFVE